MAAGGPPRVVRASASMVEFVPPAPWLAQQQHQYQYQYQRQQHQTALPMRYNTAGGGVAVDAGAGVSGSGGMGPGAMASGVGGSAMFGGLSLVATNINNDLHLHAEAGDGSNRILRNLDFR